eukprot:Phypoly_transcript_10870.p1 GENE.Phypoly_transcript_10870~~Phypoly_transcript_10870.p1  ORF type:complete len:374 (+),score=44.31 Phypoly_transcript_10870:57-1178(+)
MGDTFKLGEFEFKWSITTTNKLCSFQVLVNKPRLFKFCNSFTSEELEAVAHKKHSSTEFLEIIKTAFKHRNPRVSLAYSFVDDVANLDALEQFNSPKTGSSLVLIIELKSEFADTRSRYYLPLKQQRPSADEMMYFIAQQPSSTGIDIPSADDRLLLLELSQEVSELKGELVNWKHQARRIRKFALALFIVALVFYIVSPGSSRETPTPSQEERVVYAQFVPNPTLEKGERLQWKATSAADGHFALSTKNNVNDTISILQGGLYQVALTVTIITNNKKLGARSTQAYVELLQNEVVVAQVYGSAHGNYHNFYISNIFRCERTDHFQIHLQNGYNQVVNQWNDYEGEYTDSQQRSQTKFTPSHNYFTILKLGNL